MQTKQFLFGDCAQVWINLQARTIGKDENPIWTAPPFAWVMRCKLFQSPIVSSLQFAGDRDYLHATFSIGRKFIYVFAAKISIDSLVDPQEFVCKRLMDLPRELDLLYTS